MLDEYIRRCGLCGSYLFTTPEQRLQLLLGEQITCKTCKGVKRAS